MFFARIALSALLLVWELISAMSSKPDILFIKPGSQKQLYGSLSDYDLTAIEPPLWAAILGGHLRGLGYAVEILDAESESHSWDQTAADAVDRGARLTVVMASGHNPSASTMNMTGVGAIARRIKELSPGMPLQPLPCGTARLLFIVADKGLGIPDDKLGVICRPFIQASGDYAKTHQGAGLGLAITRHLVEAMHGTLSFDSRIGEGTSVYLTLPFAAAAPPCASALDVRIVRSESRLRALRLLLVDDEEISRLSAGIALARMPEYSVWNPAVSSLSASGRSKGARSPSRGKYRL